MFERRPFQLVWFLIEDGQLDRAAEVLTNLANTLEQNSKERHTVLSMLGAIEGDLGNYGQAADAYTELVSLDPNDALAHFNLAWVYAHQNQSTKEKEYAAKAVALDPRLAELSLSASSGSQPSDASDSKWMETDGATVAANRSTELRNKGDLNHAEEYVEKALALDKTNVKALSEDTQIQLERGRTRAALDLSKQLLAVDPQNPVSHFTRYQILNSADTPNAERQEANQELNEALRLDRQVRPVDRLDHQVKDLQLADVPAAAVQEERAPRRAVIPRPQFPSRAKSK